MISAGSLNNLSSPVNTIVEGFETQANLYNQLQDTLSAYGAVQSGVARADSFENSPTGLTLKTFQLSQQIQGNKLQIDLAKRMLAEEQKDTKKIMDLIATA
jgi:hypothetical protein